MRTLLTLLLAHLLGAWTAAATQTDSKASDLAQARTLFEANIRAIQERDREAYVACYLESDNLVRTGPDGMDFGWQELADGAPATGSDDWPQELIARDLQLTWLSKGTVYGTYRYQSNFDGVLAAGISERLFVESDAGWRIAITTAFEAAPGTPAAPLALVGATLFDGLSGDPMHDAVIITRGGRIESVGRREDTPIPAGVEVIDLKGQFVTPGWIDSHVHYGQTGWADGRPDFIDVTARYPYSSVVAELERRPDRFHRAFLSCGVTAVFDVGGYPWSRRLGEVSENSSQAPHVVAAGPLLTTWIPEALMLPDRQQFVLMESEAGVRATVRSHFAAGSLAIKVWFIVRDAQDLERNAALIHAAGEEARAVGLPLIVHATQLESARLALEAGASLLVHCIDDEDVDEAFVALALQSGASVCPTLIVTAGYGDLMRRQVPEVVQGDFEWVSPSIVERVRQTETLAAPEREGEERIASFEAAHAKKYATSVKNMMRLHRAGVPIVLGTDAGNPLTLHGPSFFREAQAMEAAGMAPLEVLKSASSAAATAMGRGRELGQVRGGAIADLVILARDPSLSTANWRSLTHVMRAGALQSRSSLRPPK